MTRRRVLNECVTHDAPEIHARLLSGFRASLYPLVGIDAEDKWRLLMNIFYAEENKQERERSTNDVFVRACNVTQAPRSVCMQLGVFVCMRCSGILYVIVDDIGREI